VEEERLPRPPVSSSLVRDEPDRDVVERSLPLAFFVEPRLLSLACCLPLALLLGIFGLLEWIHSTRCEPSRSLQRVASMSREIACIHAHRDVFISVLR
jgi:hypothetical protein